MLLNPRSDRQNIGIENDVLRWKTDVLGQDSIRTGANLDLPIEGIGLALFIKGHDDQRSPVAFDQPRTLSERLLPFLQADGIDDRFALHALQPRFDH